jgi:hypothetical protein
MPSDRAPAEALCATLAPPFFYRQQKIKMASVPTLFFFEFFSRKNNQK